MLKESGTRFYKLGSRKSACQVSNIVSKPKFYKAKPATASVLGLSHGFRDHCRQNRDTASDKRTCLYYVPYSGG